MYTGNGASGKHLAMTIETEIIEKAIRRVERERSLLSTEQCRFRRFRTAVSRATADEDDTPSGTAADLVDTYRETVMETPDFETANFSILLMNGPIVKMFTMIRKVPQELLFGLIVMFSIIGAFSTRNIMFDLWMMLLFGIAGYYLVQYNYPIAPFVIGLVLGPIAESSLRRGLIKAGGDFVVILQRPISAVLLVAAVLLFTIPLIQETRWGRRYLTLGGGD